MPLRSGENTKKRRGRFARPGTQTIPDRLPKDGTLHAKFMKRMMMYK